MPLKMVEHPESRRQTKNVSTGTLQQVELVYKVWPELNDAVVRAFLDSNLPTIYESTLYLETYELDPEPDCPEIWRVSAKYVLPQDSDGGGGQPGAVAWQFSTIGGTKNVKQSLQTIEKKRCGPNPGNLQAPDQKGAINVGEDGPEGADIYAPAFEFGLTYPVLSAAIDPGNIYDLSGKVNNGIFMGFPAGTLLFLGAEGSGEYGIGGQGKLTYKFQAAPNKSVTINQATVQKKGHEYIWCLYERKPDGGAKAITKPPTAVYVEKVYETADFNLLGI
jgi:hypothetical protein